MGCLLAWFGMCLCFLLLQKGSALHSYFCPLRGSCDAVLGSPYASLWGVPLAWFGAGYYVVLLALWLSVSGIASQLWRLRLLDCLLWLALAGLTFSLGLMYVQFAVLRAFCPLCTLSAVTVLLSALAVSQARRTMVAASTGASPRSAWMLALFASFPVLIFVTDSITEPRAPGGIALIDLAAAHRLGSAQAPVQVVVFSDFECGFCRQLTTVLHRVQAEFAPDVAIVYRHFPLEGHPRALPAAIAAECAAEQGAFWPYHDKLFAGEGDLTDARFLELAVSLGLDLQRFTACLQSAPPRQVVEANFREAMELGLPGTPCVFINGRRFQGALTYENLVKRIKEVVPKSSASAVAKPQ
ncbi:MAG: thioredoxin domain-containing protein [Chthoniobacter sp.]